MESRRRRSIMGAVVLALLALPSAARADGPRLDGLIGRDFHLDFFWQAQLGTSAALADWKRPGGIAVRGAMSYFGIGLAAALRYERVDGASGAQLSLAAQIRPIATAGSRVYTIFDPFITLGGELGGGGGGVRSAYVAGVGFDLSLFPGLLTHPAITVDYQVRPRPTPADLPLQMFQVGPTLRWTDP